MSDIQSRDIDVGYLGKLAGKIDTFIADKIKQANTSERVEKENDWKIWLNWYKGKPFYRRNAQNGLEVIKKQDRKNVHHINIIAPRVAVLVGHTTYLPRFEATHGASADTEAMMRARAAQDVANHCVRASEFPRAFMEATIHAHVEGHAWFYVGYDPTKGPVKPRYGAVDCEKCGGLAAIPGPMGDLVPCDNCGAQGVKFGMEAEEAPPPGQTLKPMGFGPKGEVCVYSVPAWEIFADPEAPSLFDIQWIIHQKQMPLSLAYTLFAKNSGIPIDDLRSDENRETSTQIFGKLWNDGRNQPTKKEYVTVSQYFQVRDDVEYPRGVHIVRIGNTVVKAGKNPFAHSKIPYVPLRCHFNPDSIYPVSTVERLMETAIATNDHLTNLHQRAHWTSAFHILSASLNGFRMGDVPGVLEYEWSPRRPEPKELQKSGISSDTVEILNRLAQQADEVSFVNEVLRGGSSFESARLAAFVDERASVPLKQIIDDQARSISMVGRLLVDTAKDFYEPGRIIQLFGPNGGGYAKKFIPDKMGSSEDVDLYAQRDLGRSLTLKRQELAELKKNGLFDDPMLFKMAEFGGDPALFTERRRHEMSAMRENDSFRDTMNKDPQTAMAVGLGPASRFENHMIHNETHFEFLEELRNNPLYGKQHPFTMKVEEHMQHHEQIDAQEQAQKQMLVQQYASAFGTQNAANPASQPSGVPEAAADAGQVPATSADPAAQGTPGPVESQPALQAVDAQFAQG